MWLDGGCHCGAVRFKVFVEEKVAIECNCSMCTKKGILHFIVPPSKFELVSGENKALSEYRFGTKTAKHWFCTNCGIHPFYEPRSHPGHVDVNVRCLDEGYESFRIEKFDGKNWEENVEKIR